MAAKRRDYAELVPAERKTLVTLARQLEEAANVKTSGHAAYLIQGVQTKLHTITMRQFWSNR